MKKNPYGTVIWIGVFLLVFSVVLFITRPGFYEQIGTYTDDQTGETMLRGCNFTKGAANRSCIQMPGPYNLHFVALSFAGNGTAVQQMLEFTKQSDIDAMRDEAKIGFVALPFMTAFLLVFIFVTSRQMRRDPIMLIGLLPIAGLIGGILHNIYYLELLRSIHIVDANLDALTFKVYLFALITWFAFAATFVMLATIILRGNAWYKTIAVVIALPMALLIGQFFYPPLAFWAVVTCYASFLWLFLLAVLFRGHKARRGMLS